MPVKSKNWAARAGFRSYSFFVPRLLQFCRLASGFADLAAAGRVFFKARDEFGDAAFDSCFGLGRGEVTNDLAAKGSGHGSEFARGNFREFEGGD